jgi:hypothetical protein
MKQSWMSKALLATAILSLAGCWNGECGGVRFVNPMTFRPSGSGYSDAQALRYEQNAVAAVGIVSGLAQLSHR